MKEYLGEMYTSSSEEKKDLPWGNMVLSLSAFLATLIGSKIDGYTWIVIVTVPVLLIACFLAIAASPVGVWARRKRLVKMDKKLLSNAVLSYFDFLKEFEVVVELVDKLQGLDWGDVPHPRFVRFPNRLSSLTSVLKAVSSAHYSQILVLNHSLKDYVDEADAYLSECNRLIENRLVNYKSELEKAEVQKLLRRYEDFRDYHDKFCSDLNCELSTVSLAGFYGQTFSLNPKEIANPERV